MSINTLIRLASFFSLVLCNLYLLYRLDMTQTELRRRAPAPEARALDALFAQYHFKTQATHKLIYFAKLENCPSLLTELQALNAALVNTPELEVVGFIEGATANELRDFSRDVGLKIPLVAVAKDQLLSASFPKTPWKVLLAPHSSRVLLSEGSSTTPLQQIAFIEKARAFLR